MSMEDNRPIPDMDKIVYKARATYERGTTRSLQWRRNQLQNLRRMYSENYGEMRNILYKDLKRCKTEADIFEIQFLINDLDNTLINLDDWTKPEYLSKGYLYTLFDDAIVYKNPYGVVLIIGSWNYPLMLTLLPMAGAIAAGNVVIIKPSEIAVESTKFMVENIPKYLDSDAVIVVEGGAEETTNLLKNKFDYMFFTGSNEVGKLIYTAAANYLTPVTLELGGKTPVYIDITSDVEIAAKRILWGKLVNAGQSCVAPDYVICTKEVQDKFVEVARTILLNWYGDKPKNSLDLGCIINNSHFIRLTSIIDKCKAKVVIGGDYCKDDRYISPTILANVTLSDKVMQKEIFGPILPVIPVKNVYEAIDFINARDNPLAIYVFSKHSNIQKLFVEQTRSGSICFNETITYLGIDSLPFGGVGNSGMGHYHGKFTFDTFSYKKSCLKRKIFWIENIIEAVRYPPYSKMKRNVMKILSKKVRTPSLTFLTHLLVFFTGFIVSYGLLDK